MDEAEIREKARQERNRYYREYRARNREKTREINRRYWERRVMRLAGERSEEDAPQNEDF